MKKSERSSSGPAATVELKANMMTFQPIYIPGTLVEQIPAPRRSIQNLMLATATAADDAVDIDPGRLDPTLRNCFLLRSSGLLLAGTGCRRPLLLREFASVCDLSGREGVVVRLGDDLEPTRSTFDIKLRSSSRMLCAYRLWLSEAAFPSAWLIPSAGEDMFLRFGEIGLDLSDRAPFDGESQRRSGLWRGANLLSIAGQGWF